MISLWVVVPLAVGCWTALYVVLRRTLPHLGAEWMCRVITLLHALVIVPSCAYVSFVQGPNPFREPGGTNSETQNVIVLISLSYFIFDFVWCLSSGTEGPVMLAHHVLSIFGNWITLLRNTCGTEMCATLFGAEISNPFLQIRFFLRQKGLHRTWYGELNDILFMLVFGFMRTIVATLFLYHYLPHPQPDWLSKSGGSALYVMGWFWWFAMLRYAYRKYTKMYREYVERKRSQASTASTDGGAISEMVNSRKQPSISKSDGATYSNGMVELPNGSINTRQKEKSA